MGRAKCLMKGEKMAEIKKITEDVPFIETVDEAVEPRLYTEHDGRFCRTKGRQARKVLGLDGIVIEDGLLCVELDE